MLEKAIEKIKTEMGQNKGDEYIQVIGEFLLQYLQDNPKAAEKILDDKKTIAKSITEMEKVAAKKQKNKRACIGPQEAIEIITKYFEFETSSALPQVVSEIKVANHEDKAKGSGFDINLDELLEEV
ncbi:MAG: hypothetical protein Q8936_06580 [Bacillota bacterium]|nr:hypothetical protein [Bacillota bacterium]